MVSGDQLIVQVGCSSDARHGAAPGRFRVPLPNGSSSICPVVVVSTSAHVIPAVDIS